MTGRAKTDSAPPILHRGIGRPTSCKSCSAAIEFAVTATGKTAPFERDPEGLYIFENGVAKLAGGGAAQRQLSLGEAPVQRYTSHFARCPQRDEWRRRRGL